MQNLSDYLVLELKAETYRNAYQKAKKNGDDRAEKFKDAYVKALKQEEGSEISKQVKKWVSDDKELLNKLKNACGNDELTIKVDGGKYNGVDNPITIKFFVCQYGNDKFFFRYFRPEEDKEDYVDKSLEDNSPVWRVLYDHGYYTQFDKLDDVMGKRFVIIQARKKYNSKSVWSEYYYDIDDKELHTDNKDAGIPAKEMPIVKSVQKILQKKIKEIGL